MFICYIPPLTFLVTSTTPLPSGAASTPTVCTKDMQQNMYVCYNFGYEVQCFHSTGTSTWRLTAAEMLNAAFRLPCRSPH